MAEIIGRQIQLGVALETTRGTAEAVAEKYIKKITANVVERSEKVVDESTRNVMEDSLGTRITKQWIEGDLEGNVHIDAFGYFMYNLYGAVVSTIVSGSVYDHVFNVANSISHPSLTLFAHDGSVDKNAFSNCMINSLELSANIDEYVKFTAGFMGKDAVTNSDTPSYETEYDFVGRDISVKFAVDEASLVSAAPIKAKELSVAFETGLISDHVFGAYAPDDVYNAKMTIEGEVALNFDDTTFKDLYLADTYQYMEVTIQGAADIGGGSNPTITLLLNRVQIMDWNRDGGADELIVQPISFKAFYNETDGKQSQMTLRNLTTEYDTP